MKASTKSKVNIQAKSKISLKTGNSGNGNEAPLGSAVIPIQGGGSNSSGASGGSLITIKGAKDDQEIPEVNILDRVKSIDLLSKEVYVSKDIGNSVKKQQGGESFASMQVKVALSEKVTNTTLKKENNRLIKDKLKPERNVKQDLLKGKKNNGQPKFKNNKLGKGAGEVDKEDLEIKTYSSKEEARQVNNPISPGQTAFTDPDSRNKYLVLQQSGLNVLRSEIIGALEFIPITGDKSEDIKQFQKRYIQDGGINSLAIRNVGRLIELHRQIRDYIVLTAEKVLERSFPEYRSDIINLLKGMVQIYFNSGQILRDQNAIDTSNKTPIEAITDRIIISNELLNKNRNEILSNRFIRSIIHSFIYSHLIDVMVKYISKVGNISEVFKKYWRIDRTKSLGIEELLGELNQRADLSSFLSKSTLPSLGNFYSKNDIENIFGIFRSESDSDSDMYYEMLCQMYGIISFNDTCTLPRQPKNINPLVLNFGNRYDLGDSYLILKNIRVPDLINVGGDTIYTRLGSYDSQRMINGDTYFNLFRKVSIGDQPDLTIDNPSIALPEAVVGTLYDYVIEKRHEVHESESGTINNLGINFLNDLGYGTERNKFNRFKNLSIFGFPSETTPRVKEVDKSTAFGNRSNPPFLFNGFNINNSGIIDMESTKTNTDFPGQQYVPGSEFYIDNIVSANTSDILGLPEDTITENEKRAKEAFKNISTNYYQQTLKFALDMSSFFPAYETIENASNESIFKKRSPYHRLKSLLFYLKKDIEALQLDTSLIPLLAMTTAAGKEESTKEQQLNTFLASFWGYVGSSHYRKALNLEIHHGEASVKIGEVSDLIASMAKYYNIEVAKYFIENICDINITQGNNLQYSFGGSMSVSSIRQVSDGSEELTAKFNNIFGSNVDYNVNSSKVLTLPIDINQSTSQSGDLIMLETSNIKSKLSTSLGGGSKDLYNVNYSDFDLSSGDVGNMSIGIFRLLKNTLSACAANIDTSTGVPDDDWWSSEINQKTINIADISGNIPSWANQSNEDSIGDYKPNRGPLSLHMHHRFLVWYKWCYDFLSTIPVNLLLIKSPTSMISDNLKLSINRGYIEKIITGLTEAINELGTGITIQNADPVINSVKSKIKVLEMAIDKRQESFANSVHAFLNHSTNLYRIGSSENYGIESIISPDFMTSIALKSFVESEDGDSFNRLKMQKTLKQTLALANPLTNSSILGSKIRNNDFTEKLIPKEVNFSLNKTRLMYKVLSQKGYGFLFNERRGLKTIMNVGIPNGFMTVMQKNAYQKTKNEKFLESPYLCITINKNNHLSDGEIYCPKIFVFDTSANILDINYLTKETSFHLKNYSDSLSIDQILSKYLEITRFKQPTINSLNDEIDIQIGTGLSEIPNVDIATNHLIDYCLKEYMKLTSGMIFDEETFLLDPDRNIIEPDLDPKYQSIFDTIINTIFETYPQVNEDPQLLNEVYRLTNVIKQIMPFASRRNFVKTIAPKKFDKVYSIIVNEKDFLLRGFTDIFQDDPVRSIGSALERPELVDKNKIAQAKSNIGSSTGDNSLIAALGNLSTSSASITSEIITDEMLIDYIQQTLGDIFDRRSSIIPVKIDSYVESLSENSPEVYNYSVNAVLLPSDFLTQVQPQSKDKKDDESSSVEFKYATADTNKG